MQHLPSGSNLINAMRAEAAAFRPGSWRTLGPDIFEGRIFDATVATPQVLGSCS